MPVQNLSFSALEHRIRQLTDFDSLVRFLKDLGELNQRATIILEAYWGRPIEPELRLGGPVSEEDLFSPFFLLVEHGDCVQIFLPWNLEEEVATFTFAQNSDMCDVVSRYRVTEFRTLESEEPRSKTMTWSQALSVLLALERCMLTLPFRAESIMEDLMKERKLQGDM